MWVSQPARTTFRGWARSDAAPALAGPRGGGDTRPFSRPSLTEPDGD